MQASTHDLRVSCPLGSRVDIEKVRAQTDQLLEILNGNARQPDRQAIRRSSAAAAQLSYLCRLREEAFLRNGCPTGS
jgi:hypothetical protein